MELAAVGTAWRGFAASAGGFEVACCCAFALTLADREEKPEVVTGGCCFSTDMFVGIDCICGCCLGKVALCALSAICFSMLLGLAFSCTLPDSDITEVLDVSFPNKNCDLAE